MTGIIEPGNFGYLHSIATLALAEVTEALGSEKAKALTSKGAECLLAAQLSKSRHAAWGGPCNPKSVHYGGWRYNVESDSADISVSGWCMIALGATAAAGIEVPGTRDAIIDAANYIAARGVDQGFGYTGGDKSPGDVRTAIGVLIGVLYGERSAALSGSTDTMDYHLPAGTQVDRGEGYPLYYAYYATRANYLRGGFAWETWRSAAIRQLLKLQSADGTWSGYDSESSLGPRYNTAMATMILRMCLNDVPAYLKQEVRGF